MAGQFETSMCIRLLIARHPIAILGLLADAVMGMIIALLQDSRNRE
jgi:hypothetical protein